jgi:ribosomal protein S3AE
MPETRTVTTMSETTDRTEFLGQQLLNKSRTLQLRTKMKEFIEEHETETDIKKLREETEGKTLSEVVNEEREERL